MRYSLLNAPGITGAIIVSYFGKCANIIDFEFLKIKSMGRMEPIRDNFHNLCKYNTIIY